MTLVPVLSAMVQWAASRGGMLPGLVLGGLGGATFADAAIWQLWVQYRLDAMPPQTLLHPIQASLNVVFAIVIVGVFPRYVTTRLWGLALTVPAAWLVSKFVLDRVWMYLC